jgi:protein-disulfide isomerase
MKLHAGCARESRYLGSSGERLAMRDMTRRVLLTATAVLSLGACSQALGGKSSGSLGDEISLGQPNAKVTVIEYASASCPHCARWNEEVFPTFKKKYIDTGKVHYIFREFLTPPENVAAAGFLLARCGGKDKYFPILDAVFRSQREWGPRGEGVRDSFLRIAQTFGMNEQQFTACVSDEKQLNALNDRVEKWQKTDNISGTPTFIVNGKVAASGEAPLPLLDAAIASASSGKK